MGTKKIKPRVVQMELYVDDEDQFRVRVKLEKEIEAAIDLIFDEGGAETPGKAMRWAGKSLDSILAGQMYDELTMPEDGEPEET